MTAPIRDGHLAALPWISLALAVAALALSYREHERRMSGVGFSTTGKVKAAGALIGAIVALSGLFVAVFQFLRGQPPATRA